MNSAFHSRGYLYVYSITSFLAGAAVLVIEMTATRALAPYFGQAYFVWTNVIGLILFALAMGNLLGGRLADRTNSPRALAAVLAAGGALVALSAFLPEPVSRWILPSDLPLEAAYPFLLKGSFVATSLCFVPPVLLLGMVSPLLVRCAAVRLERIGTLTGVLYGAGTLGAIVGTFATYHILVPFAGVRRTLLCAAVALLVSAIPLLWLDRRRRDAITVGGIALAGAALIPQSQGSASGAAFGRLIAAVESRYQHLEIRERLDLPVPSYCLAMDEGLDSFHSVTPAAGSLTGGLYYDFVPVLACEAVREGRLRVAILGFGCGTHARVLSHLIDPTVELTIVGVELDPVVIALGRSYMGLVDSPRMRLLTDMDARVFADHSREVFDLIIVDCYSSQSFVPPHLASVEFFTSLRRRLVDGGFLALNLFGYGAKDPVIEAIATTVSRGLESDVILCWIPDTANFLAYAVQSGQTPHPSLWKRSDDHDELRALKAALLAPQRIVRIRADDRSASVLHDDDGRLDRLQADRLASRARSILTLGE